MKSGVLRNSNISFLLRTGEGAIFFVELKKFLVYVFFVTCFLAGLLFYLWPQLQLLQSGIQYNGLLAQKERLVEENKALRIEMSSLKSLDRVEQIARVELGMIAPVNGQLIYVRVKRAGEP